MLAQRQHTSTIQSLFHNVRVCAYRFLKGTPHEWAKVLPIDAVACDGHEVTLGRHDITEQGQVTVVDV